MFFSRMRLLPAPLILLAALLVMAGPAHPGEPEQKFESPRLALKFLADSTVDPCPVCVEKLKKKAFKALDKTFQPGAVIVFDESCPLVKTADCGAHELAAACSREREEYTGREGQKLFFPLVLFRFHTRERNLVGIHENDYSSDVSGRAIDKKKRDSLFAGRLRIISYEYGNGKTFNYSAQRNVVVVHCMILEEEN